jgi:hypothetical protein
LNPQVFLKFAIVGFCFSSQILYSFDSTKMMIVPGVLPVAATSTVSASQQPPFKKARNCKKKSMNVNAPTLSADSSDDTLNQVWSDPDTISTATSVEDKDDFHSNKTERGLIRLRPSILPLVPHNPNAPNPSKRGKKAFAGAMASDVSVSAPSKQFIPKPKSLMVVNGPKVEATSPCLFSVQAESIPFFQYGSQDHNCMNFQWQESPRSTTHAGIQQTSPSYLTANQGNDFHQEPTSPKSRHEVIFILWKALSRFMYSFRYSIRDFSIVTKNEEMINVLIHKFSQALDSYNQEFPISGDVHQDALRESKLQSLLDQVLVSVIGKFVDCMISSSLDQSMSPSPAFQLQQQQICSASASASAQTSPMLMLRSTNGHSPFHQEQCLQHIQQPMYQMHSKPFSPYFYPPLSDGLVVQTYSTQNNSAMDESFRLMNYHEVAHQQVQQPLVLEHQQDSVSSQDLKELADFMEYFAVEDNWIVQEF